MPLLELGDCWDEQRYVLEAGPCLFLGGGVEADDGERCGFDEVAVGLVDSAGVGLVGEGFEAECVGDPFRCCGKIVDGDCSEGGSCKRWFGVRFADCGEGGPGVWGGCEG